MSALTELYKEVADCQRCDLYKFATRAVPGEGPDHAEIMFIGEAPGWNEDQQGRPFVGAAGKFLDQLIASIGLKREQVYIANVVKHRPPRIVSRSLQKLLPVRASWLDRQIEFVKPQYYCHSRPSFHGPLFPQSNYQ